RITVAPCGFDPEELWPVPQAQARARLGLEQGRFTILQLGRMVQRKGVDTVIQGLSMLRERHGIDALLLVVGGEHGQPQGQPSGQASGRPDGDGDPEVARLQALARQLGIEAHVRFVGQQPRGALRHYYSAADAFVTTPWYEPFGITPVEAMACARPVVGSEVGGIKSTVIDGVTGLLIPSRDPRALAERLAQLHADPLLARRMGEEGLRRAYRHYTWRSVASQAAAVYAAVLDEYRASTAPSLPTLQEKIMDLTHEPQDPHGAQGRRQAGQQDGQQDGQQEGQNRSAAPSSLRGKTVFITGAASGLGAALATVLARCGADIVATDIRPAALDAAAAALRELGVRVHTIGFDVADPGAVRRAIDEAFETMGRLDILINNAGTDVTLPIDELSEAEWLRVIDTNLNGPFLLAKHAAALMRQFGSGHIINVASTAAKRAWPNAAAYHASKWGLLGLSHALHAELRAHNIRVTAVVAGGMRTPFLLDRFPELDPAGLQDPMNVAEAIRSVLLMPQETVIAELTVLPMRETSWP
ncbi:MAG: Short-chain dehydrogenase/reductase, partial [Massilia sp.]|nr:Short-chain dehydrogenase/reductase [Massilia sp.]